MIDRYVDILEKTLELAWRDHVDRPTPEASSFDSSDIISIEPYAWALAAHVLKKPSPFAAPLTLHPKTRVVDSLGHARRVYRGLAFHAADVVGIGCSAAGLAQENLFREPISPANAEHLVEIAWFDLDDVQWSDFQLPGGALITSDGHANPETTWYSELILLHVLTTAACSLRDELLLDRAKRGAAYVAREIQPDHASSQPWAIHAMLLDASTVSMADLMLHSAGVQQPSTLDSVSVLLLADALLGLKRISL